MSFIKITTFYPDDHEITSIQEQPMVSAQEAFDRRLTRLNTRHQRFKAHPKKLTIRITPTEIVDYSQLLEYAETIDGFDDSGQPGLFEVNP